MVLAFSLAGSNQPVSMQAKGELDALADSDAATTDSDVRYFAYASRLRTALRTAHRYIAYVRTCITYFIHHPLNKIYILVI